MNNEMWIKILDTLLNYGVLGIAFFIFIFNYRQKEKQSRKNYQDLMNHIIKQNNENNKIYLQTGEKNIENLKSLIESLSNNIKSNNVLNSKFLYEIESEIISLKNKYEINSAELRETIHDEKYISKNVFYQLSQNIILKFIYLTIIEIIDKIDQDNFKNEKFIEIFKDSIIRIVERRKNETELEISKISFNNEKVDIFLNKFNKIYDFYILEIENFTSTIDLNSLKEDENYYRLKILIKNIIFKFSDNILNMLNDIIK